MIANLTILKSFLAVVDSGSVIAASHSCGYSAGAISRHVATLQHRLNVHLFVPAGRSIEPTREGLEFAVAVRGLLRDVEEFESYARGFSIMRASDQDPLETKSPGDRYLVGSRQAPRASTLAHPAEDAPVDRGDHVTRHAGVGEHVLSAPSTHRRGRQLA